MENRILQIIPANDWFAVTDDIAGIPLFSRVICWALVEDDDFGNVVVGMTGSDLGITEVSEGAAYCHADRREVIELDWRIKQYEKKNYCKY